MVEVLKMTLQEKKATPGLSACYTYRSSSFVLLGYALVYYSSLLVIYIVILI